MPTKRGSRYYVKRTFRGIGLVYRSLGTGSLTRAKRLEDMLVSLHDGGRADLVRAFHEGRLPIQRIAEAHEAGRISELVAELALPAPVAIEEAVRAALQDRATDVQPATLERYSDGLKHFTRLLGGSVQSALTTEAVRRFRAERIEEGVARETVNNDLVAVSILATYALERGWISKRPEIKKFPGEARISYLDPGQLRSYMAVLRRPFRAQMQVLVGTGIRLKEAEGLTVGDLRFGAEGRAIVTDAKSRDVRAVYLPAWVAENLQAHIEEHGLEGSQPLFTIKRRTVQAEHARACRLAGIVGYTIHDHRHTAAVALARAGMPLGLLQKQLGHKHVTTTMRYAGFHPDYSDVGRYFERVAETFGLSLSGNKTGNTPADADREKRG